jgi:long-subunit acyl-CoA synthetase (AMP-forming)
MRWAATQQLPGTFQDVCASAAARQHVLAQLQGCARAAGLSSLEVPHAVHLEQEEWQVGGGLLTPTAKLARHRLRQHYAEQVAEMYMGLGEVAGAAAGGR